MSRDEQDTTAEPLLEDVAEAGPAQAKPSEKRKREDDAKPESKRAAKKRKQTKKPKDVDDGALDTELGVNHAIAHMDSGLLADHLAQRTKRFQPNLSAVEAEDMHVPASAIRDASGWQKDRTTEQLPDFLDKYAAPRRKKKSEGKKLSDAPEAKGSPHTLVVAGAGLRAAELVRALRKYQTKESHVAKLFAKHIKLAEAINTAKKTRMGIGVGTPQRIIDLLDDGALQLGHIERIVVDASHIDAKKRGILDMQDTQPQLAKLLSRKDVKDRYQAEDGKIELIFF
ncbi:hypothetical protein B0A50_06488 [Salinomyces thailandicus]|uniref:Protein CMS1 n=1 Tax=Salinomyces thailandicus TaxID=706561 RepID=A0A4U0TPD9_9PEZI|nr:hypothetical protein B0A50_06488 [Salinomyces thailandica]